MKQIAKRALARFARITAVLSALGAVPAAAEVTAIDERSFITRDEVIVSASLKQVWLELIRPARWWNSAHTWSGDAANLRLVPQAGGCFCETIPEVDEPDRFTLEGSVEHMRVVQAYPERALVMRGALGPLQPEPVIGVLTIALSEVEQGTRIVWEYNVGGSMRFEVPVIARAVDGVMSEQLSGLAALLNPVEMPESGDAAEADGPPAPRDDLPQEQGAEEQSDMRVENENAIEAPAKAEPAASADGPSLEEAFSDFLEGGDR